MNNLAELDIFDAVEIEEDEPPLPAVPLIKKRPGPGKAGCKQATKPRPRVVKHTALPPKKLGRVGRGAGPNGWTPQEVVEYILRAPDEFTSVDLMRQIKARFNHDLTDFTIRRHRGLHTRISRIVWEQLQAEGKGVAHEIPAWLREIKRGPNYTFEPDPQASEDKQSDTNDTSNEGN